MHGSVDAVMHDSEDTPVLPHTREPCQHLSLLPLLPSAISDHSDPSALSLVPPAPSPAPPAPSATAVAAAAAAAVTTVAVTVAVAVAVSDTVDAAPSPPPPDTRGPTLASLGLPDAVVQYYLGGVTQRRVES
jgi:hypothetical protein